MGDLRNPLVSNIDPIFKRFSHDRLISWQRREQEFHIDLVSRILKVFPVDTGAINQFRAKAKGRSWLGDTEDHDIWSTDLFLSIKNLIKNLIVSRLSPSWKSLP